jgi:hypothetical protein
MYGKRSFLEKGMCMFMNMDKMLGGNFEDGLAGMKKIVEEAPQDKPGEEPAAVEKSEAAEPEAKQTEAADVESN